MNTEEMQNDLYNTIKAAGTDYYVLFHQITITCCGNEELLKITTTRLKKINLDYIQLKKEITRMKDFTLEQIITELKNIRDNQDATDLVTVVEKFKKYRNFFIHKQYMYYLNQKSKEKPMIAQMNQLVQNFFTLSNQIKRQILSINKKYQIFDTMSGDNFIYQTLFELLEIEIEQLLALVPQKDKLSNPT